jgi:hypothetical protein
MCDAHAMTATPGGTAGQPPFIDVGFFENIVHQYASLDFHGDEFA